MYVDGEIRPPEDVRLLKDRLNTAVGMMNTQTFFCEVEMARLCQIDPLALPEDVLPETNRQMVRSTLNEFATNMHNLALKCETASVIANDYLLQQDITNTDDESSSKKDRIVDENLLQEALETSFGSCARSGNVNFLSFYMNLVTASIPGPTSDPELVFPLEKPKRVPVMPKKAWRQRYEEEARLAEGKTEQTRQKEVIRFEVCGRNKATGAASVEDLDVLMNQEMINEEEIIDLDQSIPIRLPDDHNKSSDVFPSDVPAVSIASEVFEHGVVEDAMDRHLIETQPISPRNVSNASSRPSSSNLTHEDLEAAKDLLGFAGVEIPSEKEASEALEKMTAVKIEPVLKTNAEQDEKALDDCGLQPSIFVKREVITPDSSEIHIHIISSDQSSNNRTTDSNASVIETESCVSVVTSSSSSSTQSRLEPGFFKSRCFIVSFFERPRHSSTGTVGDIPLPPPSSPTHASYIVREPDSDDQLLQMKKKTKPVGTIQVVEVFSDDEGNTHERVIERSRTPPGSLPDEYPSQQRMRAVSRLPYVYANHSQMVQSCVPLSVPHPYPAYHAWNAHCYSSTPTSYVPHGIYPTANPSYYAHSSGFPSMPAEYDPYAPGTSYSSQQHLRIEQKRRPRTSGNGEERLERKKTRFHD